MTAATIAGDRAVAQTHLIILVLVAEERAAEHALVRQQTIQMGRITYAIGVSAIMWPKMEVLDCCVQ